jgi:hypothetical protein
MIRKGYHLRKYLGYVFIVLSIICILATLFAVLWGIIHPYHNPSEDSRNNELLNYIEIGILGILEILLLLAGIYLSRLFKSKNNNVTEKHQRKQPIPLIIYLCASVGLATLGLGYVNIGPLWTLVCQPSVFFQLVFGFFGLFGFKLNQGLINNNIFMILFHILYFSIFLFPLYRIVILNKSLDRVRIKRMKVIFILFVSLHLLITFFLVIASRN